MWGRGLRGLKIVSFFVSEGQTDLWASPFKSPNHWSWKKFKNILMFTFFPSPPPDPQCRVPLIWPCASERGLGEREHKFPTGVDSDTSFSSRPVQML